MLIVGMDSTAVSASVAVAVIDGNGLGPHALFTVKNRLTHSEILLPMLDDALRLFGAEPGDVSLLAVNVGPGSFTGVRIGVSTAKGLSRPGNIPCAPVSALEALSVNLNGFPGTVASLMDARRGQFYYALFKDGNRLTEDAAGSADEILDRLDGETWLVGDGAEPFLKAVSGKPEEKGLCLRLAPEAARYQNALTVALCGYRTHLAGKTVTGAELRPLYLRLPQAERERMERLEKENGNGGDEHGVRV
ncbi:MAG: tRNA (adenosine(37)-N6)-threonylcarbamoyltransferase complex dimerization subunit type 1 TsaB [Clostridia bacterium]|nr:tRNA (adenosine(37)-N6)-threonylcarbamoyltransferase complex dimerization subunit type 1 TsaB [Clostridia bacterium]